MVANNSPISNNNGDDILLQKANTEQISVINDNKNDIIVTEGVTKGFDDDIDEVGVNPNISRQTFIVTENTDLNNEQQMKSNAINNDNISNNDNIVTKGSTKGNDNDINEMVANPNITEETFIITEDINIV